MKKQTLVAVGLLTLGFATGVLTDQVVSNARADEPDWQKISEQPEFRRAVAEVIASCIVDNSIIYCN